jgi:hypothetical protein
MEASLSLVARERNTSAAAHNSGAVTTEVTAPFLDSLSLLTHRGQQAGLIRADLVPTTSTESWGCSFRSCAWTPKATVGAATSRSCWTPCLPSGPAPFQVQTPSDNDTPASCSL